MRIISAYLNLERVKGLKPLSPAWKAGAQSLYHTRITRFTARLNAYAYLVLSPQGFYCNQDRAYSFEPLANPLITANPDLRRSYPLVS